MERKAHFKIQKVRQSKPKQGRARQSNVQEHPRVLQEYPRVPPKHPKRAQEWRKASQDTPKKTQNHPKCEPRRPRDPSKNAHAIRTLFTAFREGGARSVHYIQCFVRLSRNTVYRIRIGPDPHEMLYIVYGSHVPFWRGFNGFVDRAMLF